MRKLYRKYGVCLLILMGLWLQAFPVRAEEAEKRGLKIQSVEVDTSTAEYAGTHDGWVKEDTVFTITVQAEPEQNEEDEIKNEEESENADEKTEDESVKSEEAEETPEELLADVVVAWVKNDESWEHAYFPEGVRDGNIWTFSFEEQDEEFVGVYRFAVYDSLENGKAESEADPVLVEFKKDKTAPALQVDYGAYANELSGKRFYREEENAYEEVTLTFTERFFMEQTEEDGAPVLPFISVAQNGIDREEEDLSDWLSWESYDRESGQIRAVLRLPYETGAGGGEVEYRIRVHYLDGAGNELTIKEGAADTFGAITVENGYESRILVLDNRPPCLLAWEIKGEEAGQAEGFVLYKNQEDADDVTVRLDILENADCWDPARADLLVLDQKTESVIASSAPERLGGTPLHGLCWSSQADIHRAVFGFDGEEQKASAYAVKIFWEDPAGNLLYAEEGVSVQRSEEGALVSEAFFLDHVCPIFEISYNEPFWRTGNTAYYGEKEKNIAATVIFEEQYAAPGSEEESPGGIECLINGEPADVSWNKTDHTYTGSFFMEQEGDYQVTVSGRDLAGNFMEAKTPVSWGHIQAGTYESRLLTLDLTAPAVRVSYDSEPVNVYEGRKFFQEETKLRIRIEDQHMGSGPLKRSLENMEVTDAGGGPIKDSRAEEVIRELEEDAVFCGEWEVEIPIETDGNYRIPVEYTDLAGNRALSSGTELVTKDRTPGELRLTHTPEHFVNYRPFGHLFSGQPVKIQAESRDHISGIRLIRYTVTDEQGEIRVLEETSPPSEAFSSELLLPEQGADFKGTVRTEVYDWCNNRTEEIRSYVVESEKTHESTGKLQLLTLTDPSRTVGGENYWNTDVKLMLSIEDTGSGIGSVRYRIGNDEEEETDLKAQAGRDPYGEEPSAGITEEMRIPLTIDAASNNENGVMVYAEYTDNAGHTESWEQIFHVDTVLPEITVEYDQNDPIRGQFYHQPRTARITIRERNFSPEDAKLLITGTEGAQPGIGEWTVSGEGDDTRNSCRIVFDQDGDYTVTAEFVDLAGNRAVYDRVDTFTIDRTKPELAVIYDNDEPMNEIYFNRSRNAAIRVKEQNFDPELLEIRIESEDGPIPQVSGWTSREDFHTAHVTFAEDGSYTLKIAGRDQADNAMEVYEESLFVIDRTAPVLKIQGVEDRSANNEEVMPVIWYQDRNPAWETVNIELRGHKNGRKNPKLQRTAFPEGLKIALSDPEHVPETDDLYTLKASASDLAGNKTEVEILYSVNRFGSVYTFDEATEALLGNSGTYYTNEAPDLVITETNVDTLEFQEITCSLNGTLRTLQENEDYVVSLSGEEESWKQYRYCIGRQNFQEEGTYLLTLYSRDRASNVSDNYTKGKKMEFAVDHTAPSILISGIGDKDCYRESRREITLDVEDNVRLKEVRVLMNKRESIYPEEELRALNGRIVLTAVSDDHWQTIRVTALDAAGNRAETGTLSFLLTSSLMVSFFWNFPRFLAALTILLLILFCAVRYTIKRVLKQKKI